MGKSNITAESLLKKYKRDLMDLQKSCTHKKVSDWVNEYWAPGHSTGRMIRICNRCESIVEMRGEIPFTFEMDGGIHKAGKA